MKLALFLDGQEVPQDQIFSLRAVKDSPPCFHITLRDDSLRKTIFDMQIREIAEHIQMIDPQYEFEIYDGHCSTMLHLQGPGETWFVLNLELFLAGWKNPWSPKELLDEMATLYNQYENNVYIDEDMRDVDLLSLEIQFHLDADATIDAELQKRRPEVITVWRKAEENLQAKLDQNSIVSHFNFPEEIRSACEQYLLYFVQFLKDVGIDASARIEHDGATAGQVLFSVTPEDGKSALDKVRQALDAYLDLGQMPNVNPDFAARVDVQRLQSQVLHFQSQLMLGQAIIQQKDAALELKDELIRQIRSGEIFSDSNNSSSSPLHEVIPSKSSQIQMVQTAQHQDFAGFTMAEFTDLVKQWASLDGPVTSLSTFIHSRGKVSNSQYAKELPSPYDQS